MIKQKHSRLIASFEKQNKSLTFGNNPPVKKILVDTMNHLKKNWKQTNDDIIKVILDLQLEGEYRNEVNREECVKWTSIVSDWISTV